jgi:hypothetical protein
MPGYVACINPECRRPMRMAEWEPGLAALWECEECVLRVLLGHRLLDGSYTGRLLLAPAYASQKEPEHP